MKNRPFISLIIVSAVSLFASIVCFAESKAQKDEPNGLKSEKNPGVEELLKIFANKRNAFNSFIVEYDSKVTFSYGGPKVENFRGVQYRKTEVRVDDRRGSSRSYQWGNLSTLWPNVLKEQSHYYSQLWDGENLYSYNRAISSDPGMVFLYRGKDLKGVPEELKNIGKIDICAEMMGYHGYDNGKSIAQVLEDASHLQIRQKQENLRGADCFVIDADVKGKGKYTVWIDPLHDYHIAKIHVRRGENDYINNRKLQKNDSSDEIYEVLQFQKIGESWFPLEAKSEFKWHHGETASRSDNKKISTFKKINVNPDHDAMKSFIPDDIPSGTPVKIAALPPSMELIWKDGKVIDKAGKVIMDPNVEKKKPAKPSIGKSGNK